MIEGTTSSII
jgi:hypothetical protein